MNPLWTVMREGGPWFALLFLAILTIIGFAFALSRGILVRGAEVDRIERRIEKDTDRVLALYVAQIASLNETVLIKERTIEKQAVQIERLITGNSVATEALDKIVKEAEKRGHLPAQEEGA